jgi:hypothetical protein
VLAGATIQAASTRYGATSAEVNATRNAWAAVGVAPTTPPPRPLPPPIFVQTPPLLPLAGAAGAAQYFAFSVPVGLTSATFRLSPSAGSTGDADLYVMQGRLPSRASFDCRSRTAGSSEDCTFTAPTAGTYYVMVYGASAYAGVSLTMATTRPPSTVLSSGVPVTGLSAAAGASVSYTFVNSGAVRVTIAISGGAGDADLYVRYGSAPTTTTFNCRPYLAGNNETCTFNPPQVGTYHVMVRGYAAFAGVSLVATAQ